MRHLLANAAVYALAALLVALAVGWAALRSSQTVLAREAAVEPVAFEAQRVAGADPLALGRDVYVANCTTCHGTDGAGRDVYPPVVGQAAVLAAPGGAAYVAETMLYGVWTGRHAAPMPPTPNLSDAQIAAVAAYVVAAFPGPADPRVPRLPLAPSDVAALRGREQSEWDTGARRPAVPLPAALASPALP